MSANRTALRGGVITTLGLLLFAALALLNYIAGRHLLARWDLTESKAFTVAPATRKIVSDLDDVINVKLYLSRNLPDQATVIQTRVRDLLKELEAFSQGKLKVEEVDTEDEKREQEARSMGIPKIPLQVLEKSKVQTVEAFLGLVMLYADKKEVIPSLLDTSNLEYDVVSAILKLTQPKKKLGFLTGHDEADPSGEMRALGDQLRKQYDVETVDLSNGKSVAEGITTLVVAGPKRPLDERARYEIDQFLMRGGNALFLIDMFDVDPMQLMVRPIDSGLVDQIARYGVRIKSQMAADWTYNEIVQMPSGNGMLSIVPYPLWPKIAPKYLSESNPVVNQLSSLVLPWTAPLEPINDPEGKIEVVELARTTEFATAEDKLFSANPRFLKTPETKAELTQLTVVASISGPIKSFFAGKPVPEPQATPPSEDPTLAPPEPSPTPAAAPAARLDQGKGSQIVVVGSSEFARDNMLKQRAFISNLVFVLNALDWLTMGSDLVGIRSRVVGEPLLDPNRVEELKSSAPWLSIAVMPILIAMVGWLRHRARRSRRVVLA